MYPQSLNPYPTVPQIPPRVQAALQFLGWYASVGQPCMPLGSGDMPRVEPDRTKQEIAAYNSALQVAQLYFSGEMDYGDCAPVACRPPDDPEAPQPEFAQ